MTRERMMKLTRCLIVSLMFLCITYVSGMELRQSQEILFMLGSILVFSLLLDNIWLTLFIVWSVFLFTFYKFQIGGNYLTNLFCGSVLFMATKTAVKKEHINFIINGFLWVVFANLCLMIFQCFNLDFMFKTVLRTREGIQGFLNSTDLAGFMGYKAGMGMLMAMAVPILASRPHKWAVPTALSMYVPIYISKASICIPASIIGLLVVLWYKWRNVVIYRMEITKKQAVIILGTVLISLGSLYIVLVDMPMGIMPTRIHQWYLVAHDCTLHPITGWGLDSFRNMTPQKQHIYAMNMSTENGKTHFDWWDNPHNLAISLFFEWGVLGLFLFIGYLRYCIIRFRKSVIEPNSLALYGFLWVTIIVSIAQFPFFLGRMVCFIIPLLACFDIQTREVDI